ncbi:glycosyltransferase family 39 protein [Candidatus Microgenomates bacterium]|nr:glycosyltransferase family 39 protein [Candidatus Microgenomates bacterium]
MKFIPLILLTFLAPLFFYKLGESSLVSWDEAWYADIARNILNSGDIFHLTWNGGSYVDHPPAGFWLMAIIFKIFGVSEFWARFPSALLGLASVYVLYFLSKELFNRTVGFASALALPSTFWFLYRARSGNLDILLTFFFLLTILLAIKAAKQKLYLWPFSISLALLLLTKTVVPFTIPPILLIIFWRAKRFKIWDFIWPFILPLSLFILWFVLQLGASPDMLNYYFKIGLPGVKVGEPILQNFLLIKEYLHSGVGKWFWPGILGLILGILTLQKRFLILTVFAMIFFMPFLFSERGQIWHLIPLYPILTLVFFGLAYVLIEKVIKNKWLVSLMVLSVGIYFSFMQIRQAWYQFVDIPAFVSDEAILSSKAHNYPYRFYIDGDFYPVAVFYSQKNVQQIWSTAIPEIFNQKEQSLLITKQERLDGAKIAKNRYQVLAADRDKILILKE